MTFEVFLEENDKHSVLGGLSIRKSKVGVKKKGGKKKDCSLESLLLRQNFITK
jgi:hypothetical protein